MIVKQQITLSHKLIINTQFRLKWQNTGGEMRNMTPYYIVFQMQK